MLGVSRPHAPRWRAFVRGVSVRGWPTTTRVVVVRVAEPVGNWFGPHVIAES